MTEIEHLVLVLVERHLREWRCSHCGKIWLTGKSQAGLWHSCRAQVRRIRSYRAVEEENARRSREWAERQLGLKPIAEALDAALGDRALLDVEEEE